MARTLADDEKPSDGEFNTPFPPDSVKVLVLLTGHYLVAHSLMESRLRLLANKIAERMGDPGPGASARDLSNFLKRETARDPSLVGHADAIMSAVAAWIGCKRTRDTLAHRIPVTFRYGKSSPRLVTFGFNDVGRREYREVIVSAACADIERMSAASQRLQAALSLVFETEE